MTRQMHDGARDGLRPLESLDPSSVKGFADMLGKMSKTAFGGRALGEALEVLMSMGEDRSCRIVVTVSGAMTVAKMGGVLCRMIECGLAHAVVATGAILAHGLSEAVGGVHYRHDPRIPDPQLYEWGYNRIHDTLEMEANLSEVGELVRDLIEEFGLSRPACSRELNERIGRRLAEKGQMPSILGLAYEHGVPVYVPALTDSELALDLATAAMFEQGGNNAAPQADPFLTSPPLLNPFVDLYHFTQWVLRAERLGIFTVGGGVPRNWAQQVGPFVEIINRRLGRDLKVPRYAYGVRICPEPAHWGGLSGCTYSEGVSWGKFYAEAEGGRFAEVMCDATIAWPILIKAALEKLTPPTGEDRS